MEEKVAERSDMGVKVQALGQRERSQDQSSTFAPALFPLRSVGGLSLKAQFRTYGLMVNNS